MSATTLSAVGEPALFERLLGRWDADVVSFDPLDPLDQDGHWKAVWRFRQLPGGQAIQDVLIDSRLGRRLGVSLRAATGSDAGGELVWLGAIRGDYCLFHGCPTPDTVRLQSEPDCFGVLHRWEFTHLSDDAFAWSGSESDDQGRTWRIRRRMTCVREHGR